MATFPELGVNRELLLALSDQGFTTPTPIQAAIIPLLLERATDLIGLAQTGTGKTAAFGIPVMQLADAALRRPQALILCPTRELCVQVTRDLLALASHLPRVQVTAVYGGAPIEPQIRALRQGSQVIVATPGRLNDHLRRGSVDLSTIQRVVLDEADEMLNMGFKEELNTILAATPAEKNTMLFSATMSREVAAIAATYMNDPEEITIGAKNVGAENVRHLYYMVHAKDRYLALKRIADLNPDIYAIIFCRTRQETQEVAEKLITDGYSADSLHGDLSQNQRDQVMNKFRAKTIRMLVATDVAARGLDVNDLSHVINYNLPDDLASYTHRSGRTGRAGKSGVSIAIINLRELFKVRNIERQLKKRFEAARVPGGKEVCERQLLNLIDTVKRVQVDHARIEPFLAAVHEKLADLDREELIKRFVSLEFNRFLDYYRNAPDLNVTTGDRGKGPARGPRTDDKRPPRHPSPAHSGDERPWRDKGSLSHQAKSERQRPAATIDPGRPATSPRPKKPLELNDFLDQPADGSAERQHRFPRPKAEEAVRFTRFFINVGKKDGVHAGRLIGEINDRNGGSHIKVGKIEIRETTSVIEADRRYTAEVLNSFNNLQINGKPVAIEATGDSRPQRPAQPPWGRPAAASKTRGKTAPGASRKHNDGWRPAEVEKAQARRQARRPSWRK